MRVAASAANAMPIDLEKAVSEMLLPMLPLSRFALNEKEGRKVKEH